MELGLRGKVALVTAASAGIGRAVARELAAGGASLALCARGEARLAQAGAELREETGAEVLTVTADVASADDRAQMFDQVLLTLGRVDILVNNCGQPPALPVTALSPQILHHTIDLVLLSMVDLSLRAVAGMRQRRWGRIVNMASVCVIEPMSEFCPSNVVRPSVVGFSKSLSDEVASDNVTVNVVCPGFVMTGNVEALEQKLADDERILPGQVHRRWTNQIPMGRMGRSEEVAALVAFLASDQASYITGTAIPVDGGLVRRIP